MLSRVLLSVGLCLALTAGGQGFLKAKDRVIVNGKGEKVMLRGMSLGGWMLQEGYMFHLGNMGQQYRIKEKIEELIGHEKTETFYHNWLANHTTKADIDSLAAWGFNSIRLPMHYRLYTLPVEEEPVAGGNTWLDKGFAMTDSLLSWCKANKMYLILDLHAAPGGQGNDLAISDRNPARPSLWQSEAAQQKTVALWRKLAQRYAAEPWIGGYDIINEPNWGFEDAKDFRGTAEKKNGPLRKLMMEITAAIREVDTAHIIIIEGNGFGNNYNGVLPAWDKNVVLSFHKYGNFNTTAAISNFLRLREQYDIPLWLGESGENSNTWFTEAIRLAEQNDIGWAWWQGKKMGINNPLEIREPQDYRQLLSYWSGKGEKPSPAAAEKVLGELITNLSIRNNIYHKDVTDAMFRQVATAATQPFKAVRLTGKPTVIHAVDYDLGRHGAAYFDRDTASYQYTPGVKTVGNRGRMYRNDGVDIQADSSGPYVFSIEDGEWLQYTITVKHKGSYSVSFTTAAANNEGRLSLLDNGKSLLQNIPVAVGNSEKEWKSTPPAAIDLSSGMHQLRVYADKGGFTLSRIQLVKKAP